MHMLQDGPRVILESFTVVDALLLLGIAKALREVGHLGLDTGRVQVIR